MIADQIKVIRQCEYCRKTRTDIEPFLYLSINHVMGVINRSNKQCGNCRSRSLKIVNIQIKILEGWIYGDTAEGYWKCPSHPKIYYPAAIRKAMEDGYSSVADPISQSYDTIATAGFPWRCPICNEEMYYFDEREYINWAS